MSALQERELKQEGAIEAAEENMISADDAEKEMVEQSRNAGIPAFKFDPDATPEQKRAQAQAVSFSPLSLKHPRGRTVDCREITSETSSLLMGLLLTSTLFFLTCTGHPPRTSKKQTSQRRCNHHGCRRWYWS